MRKITKNLAMAIMFLLAPAAYATEGSATAQPIGGDERAALFPSRDVIDFGKSAVESNCASCHGLDGISDEAGKPHLAGQRTVYLYRVLKAFQSGERADVTASHNDFLNDKALLAAAVYYASLTPKSTTEATTAAEGEESSAPEAILEDDPFIGIRGAMTKCVKCHGEDGNAKGSGMPNLTGQHPDYFVAAMMGYLDGSRSHKLMKRLVSKLDEATIKDMGVFYAVQKPESTTTVGEGDVNVGHRLAEKCSACHGDDGNANKSTMPSLAGQDARYFIKAMKQYKDGMRQHEKMFEAVKALTEQEVTDLAAYYATQEPRKRDVRMPLGSTQWITRCERCHGIDGNSSDPRFPLLAGQDETYLRQAMGAYATGVRKNSTMHAMSDPLSSYDIERISAYFASQQPKAVIYMQLPCGDDQQK